MTVLVTGGAGYIGSHAVKQLRDAGRDVVVIDSLARGHHQSVPADVPFYQCSLSDEGQIALIMILHGVEEVLHFAAYAYVGESVDDPLMYYENNTAGTISLLLTMQFVGVKRLVFSSTCATYGQPESVPITEQTPQTPINPYGHSKLMVEQILRDLVKSDAEWSVTSLRYFNVAGCAEDGSLGAAHDPETRVLLLAIKAALRMRESFTIFGNDYDTPDGTCIRDYIHVDDLSRAHLLALERLTPGEYQVYNLGIGRGFSVQEVVDSVERVTGQTVPVVMGDRRAGDPPVLYADASKIQSTLGWQPKFTELDDIVTTAWNWMEAHPSGYGE